MKKLLPWIGAFALLIMYQNAFATQFLAVDLKAGHHKHESALCRGGGTMSKNLTFNGEIQYGIVDSDFRYYVYYSSERCIFNGESQSLRYEYTRRVDEELGIGLNWQIQF